MTCPASRTIQGHTLQCQKKDGHYGPKNPHRSQWEELGFIERAIAGMRLIRVEWFDA